MSANKAKFAKIALKIPKNAFSVAKSAPKKHKIANTLNSNVVATMTPSPHTSSVTTLIAACQEQLSSVEQSLSGVVQYLNTNDLTTRIDSLEKAVEQIKVEVSRISREIAKVDLVAPVTPASGDFKTPKRSALPHWQEIHKINQHRELVTATAISPNNKLLATAMGEGTLALWDLATGSLLGLKSDAHSASILALNFAGNNYLASGGFDQKIKIWQIQKQEGDKLTLVFQRSLQGHHSSIRSLISNHEGTIIISASYDQTIKKWQLESGELISSVYDASGAIYTIAFNRQQQILANGGADGRVCLWSLEEKYPLQILQGNSESITSVDISAEGNNIAIGCIDGTIKLWQRDTHNQVKQPQSIFTDRSASVVSIQFTNLGKYLLSASSDGKLRIHHLNCNQYSLIDQIEDEITSLKLSSNEEFLVIATRDGSLRIFQNSATSL